jgi:hypothetical protein
MRQTIRLYSRLDDYLLRCRVTLNLNVVLCLYYMGPLRTEEDGCMNEISYTSDKVISVAS